MNGAPPKWSAVPRENLQDVRRMTPVGKERQKVGGPDPSVAIEIGGMTAVGTPGRQEQVQIIKTDIAGAVKVERHACKHRDSKG